MHRKQVTSAARRIARSVRRAIRALTTDQERRALDEWCAAIERDLAARPWLVRYG